MDQIVIKNIIEASLFAAGRPMSINEMLRLFSEEERPERKTIRAVLDTLTEEYADRGISLIEVASGYRIQVRQSMSEWLGRLNERKPPRYSRASLETLALIAYRQPITRGDIEEVRGVSVSSNIIRTLLERGWIRIVGHRDVPGRPAMFGTTKEFLDYFNLKTLDELPSLADLQDIDHVNAELDFGDAPEPPESQELAIESAEAQDGVNENESTEAPASAAHGDEPVTDSDAGETAGFVDDKLDDDDDFDGWGVDADDDEDDSATTTVTEPVTA